MTPEIYASVMRTIYLNAAVTTVNFLVSCLMLYTAFRQWKLAKLQRSIGEQQRAIAMEAAKRARP